jgi:triosephosphate isomerase
MKPIIITNFKAYEQSTGENALKLAKAHDSVAKHKDMKGEIMVAVQNADIFRISQSVSIHVIAQHADPVEYGKHTGSELPECLKENGAWGVLINHSEDRADIDTIEATIKRCKAAGLKTIVCVENMDKAKQAAKMDADYLAYEVPELIGTLQSISKLEPGTVQKFSDMVKDANEAKAKSGRKRTIPLCGAGVADRNDVENAIKLGTEGVLLATAIVKAKDPTKALEDFVR